MRRKQKTTASKHPRTESGSDKVYAYHVTPKEFLSSIASKGLRSYAHRHVGGRKVIFVEPDQALAEVYATTDTKTLRFKVTGFGSTPDGEAVLFNTTIPPKEIEVLTKKGWVSLLSIPASKQSDLATRILELLDKESGIKHADLCSKLELQGFDRDVDAALNKLTMASKIRLVISKGETYWLLAKKS